MSFVECLTDISLCLKKISVEVNISICRVSQNITDKNKCPKQTKSAPNYCKVIKLDNNAHTIIFSSISCNCLQIVRLVY